MSEPQIHLGGIENRSERQRKLLDLHGRSNEPVKLNALRLGAISEFLIDSQRKIRPYWQGLIQRPDQPDHFIVQFREMPIEKANSYIEITGQVRNKGEIANINIAEKDLKDEIGFYLRLFPRFNSDILGQQFSFDDVTENRGIALLDYLINSFHEKNRDKGPTR